MSAADRLCLRELGTHGTRNRPESYVAYFLRT